MDDYVIGWIGCFISALFFGSMLVPVKPYDMRDGFYVQWVEAGAIFVCGFVVHLSLGMPQIYNAGIWGGMIWATGNVCTVPIVNAVGMGLSSLIAGSLQIISGWAAGRFGWFGLKAEVPKSNLLEYLGVVVTLVSNSVRPQNEKTPIVAKSEAEKNRNARFRMLWAVGLSIFCGLVLGQGMTPITYFQDTNDAAPRNGLYYAFPYGIGAFVAATVYFLVYALIRANRPYILPQVTLPSLAYGAMWSVAMFSWFVSAGKMSQSITFPINSRLPGIVMMLWGLLYYREVKGKTNLLLLFSGIVVAIAGVVMVGLAKVVEM